MPTSVDPNFDDDFIIDLAVRFKKFYVTWQKAAKTVEPFNANAPDNDLSSLLQANEQIQLTIIRVDEEGQTTFVCGHMLEWRKVLKKGVIVMSIEMGGGSSLQLKVPKGVLEIRLELIPRPKLNIPEPELLNQVRLLLNQFSS